MTRKETGAQANRPDRENEMWISYKCGLQITLEEKEAFTVWENDTLSNCATIYYSYSIFKLFKIDR